MKPEADAIPPEVLDLARWLAKCLMDRHAVVMQAAALRDAEAFRDFVIDKSPIVQGSRNQWDLEKVGAQPVQRENVRIAIDWLLAHPRAGDPGGRLTDGPEGAER